MSRIGLQPIELPSGVEVSFDDSVVTVKGPKGELSQKIDSAITAVSYTHLTLPTILRV